MDKAIKRVIQRLIPAKFYESIASRLIGFSKVTSITILTHLITEYAELDDDTIQDIDDNMKTPINGEILFEEFLEQIEWKTRGCGGTDSLHSKTNSFDCY